MLYKVKLHTPITYPSTRDSHDLECHHAYIESMFMTLLTALASVYYIVGESHKACMSVQAMLMLRKLTEDYHTPSSAVPARVSYSYHYCSLSKPLVQTMSQEQQCIHVSSPISSFQCVLHSAVHVSVVLIPV